MYKVLVNCMTFNQAKYITDALEGFTMQQTNFPFICIIIDDASTDGEQNVIKKFIEDNFDFSQNADAYHKETDYAYITFAQHKTNHNCFFYVLYLKENHYSNPDKYSGKKMEYLSEWRNACEYEAICEGDDYWIDPLKLQRQVSYMDCHNDCSLCFTAVEWYYQSNNTFVKKNVELNFNKTLEYNQNKIVENILDSNKYYIQTNTVLYRLMHYNKIQDEFNIITQSFLMEDSILWCLLKKCGSFHYDDTVTSIYRINTGSVSHQKSIPSKLRFYLSGCEMKLYMYGYMKLNNSNLLNKFEKQYKLYYFLYRAYNKNYNRFIEMKWQNSLFKNLYEWLNNKYCSFIISKTFPYLIKFRNIVK